MNGKILILYYDRERGAFMTEHVYWSTFLYWLYNTISGRFAAELFFERKCFSQIYGWLHRMGLSRRKNKSFIRKMNVNLEESIRRIENFRSFNDFFTREIDLSKRPINQNPYVCVAPADGKILAYSFLRPDMTFPIKRSWFNLRGFLRDEELTEKFARGSMIISRLCLTDYHHFHFPDSGIPARATPLMGRYHAGGPYGLRRLIPFYSENFRMVTLFESDHFGQIGMVEIGALTVGSIQQRYQPRVHVTKGTQKGFFELGGSTVALLFQRGMIELDEDLLAKTRDEIETYVRLGDSIGRTSKPFIER